jgi:hypothetical protein
MKPPCQEILWHGGFPVSKKYRYMLQGSETLRPDGGGDHRTERSALTANYFSVGGGTA